MCWQPQWPEDIVNAGLPGKPKPKNTTLDDYPKDIQERLLLNADRWLLMTEDGEILRNYRT
ncbi:hypothetical protein EKN56_07300 [Limnobaculum zhutongyuii]|uniref:Uncharacterized protein n=1 Tax=Limnobaculum zhutongyuii TaxID=2498113 RepID=A0A411WJ62_9GAMM|nr:hypothetical protein [Limnobaculum zhutongyuii]QBH96222.1 hypothetical protein EKN56_07300 [Limnobaculum zhutongyuii]TQS86187.1 hypothetical protein ELQ32_20050 [Limnobaculum zhutongyuii]